MQVCTANYSHLWSPVNSLVPGGNKGYSYLKLQVCLSNTYEHLLLPGIKVLKLFYMNCNLVTVH